MREGIRIIWKEGRTMTKKQLETIPKKDLIEIMMKSRTIYELNYNVVQWFDGKLLSIINELRKTDMLEEHKKWEKLNKEYVRLNRIWSE